MQPNKKPNTIEGDARLSPGVYLLTKDVAGIKPDRRKTDDWTAIPQLNAGIRFIVRKKRFDGIPGIGIDGLNMIYTGRWSHIDEPGYKLSDEFVAALTRVEPTLDEALKLTGRTPINYKGDVLDVLVSQGIVTTERVLQICDEIDQ